MSTRDHQLHILIVGAGIGGLTTAIACRRANPPLRVTVLERNPEVLAIGAGIHIPPNACRVLTQFGLLDKLKQAGGYEVDNFKLRRYEDGQVLASKPLKNTVQQKHGAQWLAIQRGDYQHVLLEEAKSLGAKILLHAEAIRVETSLDTQTIVYLKDGRQLLADVVIGADGLWSHTRDVVLGKSIQPHETGDLAYRATFSRSQLLALCDSGVEELLDQSNLHVWLGAGKHAVFYPLRNHQEYNLVLLVADDLPAGVRTASGTMDEMMGHFEGWDPRLTSIIASSTATPLKWKLLHLKELKQWTRDTIALLGDACHPTLPYLGQGAAMAVEDGATLGLMMAEYNSRELPTTQKEMNQDLSSVLRQYEQLRKTRAETIVSGSEHTRHYYHLSDGPEQQTRDEELAKLAGSNFSDVCSFIWGDANYQQTLLSHNVADSVSKTLLSDSPTTQGVV